MEYLNNLFSYLGFNSNYTRKLKLYNDIKEKYTSTDELFRKLEYYNFDMTKHLNIHYDIYKYRYPVKEDYYKSDLYLDYKNKLMYKACRAVQLNSLYVKGNIDDFLNNCKDDELELLLQ